MEIDGQTQKVIFHCIKNTHSPILRQFPTPRIHSIVLFLFFEYIHSEVMRSTATLAITANIQIKWQFVCDWVGIDNRDLPINTWRLCGVDIKTELEMWSHKHVKGIREKPTEEIFVEKNRAVKILPMICRFHGAKFKLNHPNNLF